MSTARHGTASRYVLGCRCPLCRAAAARAARTYRQRRRIGLVRDMNHRFPVPDAWRCRVDGCGRLNGAVMCCLHPPPWERFDRQITADCRAIALAHHTRPRMAS